MKKLLLVFNPYAGKGKIKRNLSEIIDVFTKNGYLTTAITTQYAGQAEELVLSMSEAYDIVVVSGGDGTLKEAVTGLARMGKDRRPLLGYIPAGSTNDFARSLGLPSSILGAAQAIVKGEPVTCDLGRFQEDSFTYVAAFGAFTEVTYATKQEYKNLIGHQAYYIEGVKGLSSIKPIQMKVQTENEEIEGKFLYGMVSNSKSIGGVKNWAGKDVCMNDGLFELTLVREVPNPISLSEAIVGLFGNKSSDYIVRRKVTDVKFISQLPVDWVLDGEFGGSHTQVRIQAIKEELRILV